MEFNDLLAREGIRSEDVLVLRHRPSEPRLAKVLPWLAAERPDLFNAYQQTQRERAEVAFTRSKLVASFIGTAPGRALFVGLYEIGDSTPLTYKAYWDIVAIQELGELGMRGFQEDDARDVILWFDLALTDFYAKWKGKLLISWPPPERSWWRRSHKNTMPVLAIHEESALVAGMPEWNEIVLEWKELLVLPERWRQALAQWRGIYFICDMADGMGYVGSAYGDSNILGRWVP